MWSWRWSRSRAASRCRSPEPESKKPQAIESLGVCNWREGVAHIMHLSRCSIRNLSRGDARVPTKIPTAPTLSIVWRTVAPEPHEPIHMMKGSPFNASQADCIRAVIGTSWHPTEQAHGPKPILRRVQPAVPQPGWREARQHRLLVQAAQLFAGTWLSWLGKRVHRRHGTDKPP